MLLISFPLLKDPRKYSQLQEISVKKSTPRCWGGIGGGGGNNLFKSSSSVFLLIPSLCKYMAETLKRSNVFVQVKNDIVE